MNNLRNKKYSWLKAQRGIMLNAKAFSIDDEDRAAFQKAIDGLDGEMYRREATIVQSAVALITVLVLLSIVSGCAKTMQGTGLIFEGLGDAVVAGGQHLQESASKEK